MGEMDSGNSGSFQSSSGGDDDYESSRGGGGGGRGGGVTVDSFSSFFNHQNQQTGFPATGHVTSFNHPPPPSFFDPLTSYLDHLSRSTNQNPVINSDPLWPKDPLTRPDPIPSTSGPSGLPNPQPPTVDRQPNQARNPRKRTRASRRAPTTVLTTDTNNFRAMVQEFTGIPAPPFGSSGTGSSSLFFPRTRFDLFSNNPPIPNTALPSYLLRPLAQKIPPPLISTITTTKTTHDVIAPSSSAHFQIPSFKYPSLNSDHPSPSKPAPTPIGSLELPITTRNDDNDQLRRLTASFITTDAVNSSASKTNGGPLGWAEGLGLGADGAPATSGRPSGNGMNTNNDHHSHAVRPQNLGFAHQQIG